MERGVFKCQKGCRHEGIWNSKNLSRELNVQCGHTKRQISVLRIGDFSHTQAGYPGSFLLTEYLGRSQRAV